MAVTKLALADQDGPAILVGHSYGGVVVREAGNDPKVAGLVYIAASAPDAGESVSSLIANPPEGAPVPPILPPKDGFLFLDRAKFPDSFAADVDPDKAAFMADSQVPWGLDALGGSISEPAWKSKPSWYLISTEDKMIPPPAQQFMSERAGTPSPSGTKKWCLMPDTAFITRQRLKRIGRINEDKAGVRSVLSAFLSDPR